MKDRKRKIGRQEEARQRSYRDRQRSEQKAKRLSEAEALKAAAKYLPKRPKVNWVSVAESIMNKYSEGIDYQEYMQSPSSEDLRFETRISAAELWTKMWSMQEERLRRKRTEGDFMAGELYTGERVRVYINDRPHMTDRFSIVFNNIAQQVSTSVLRQEKVAAVIQEREVRLLFSPAESKRIMRIPIEFTSGSTLEIRMDVTPDIMISGVGLIKSWEVLGDGSLDMTVYLTSKLDAADASNKNVIIAGKEQVDSSAARERERMFKDFIASKDIRQDQKGIVAAYNDRYNFYKYNKIREGFKEAAIARKMKEAQYKAEVERANLFRDRKDDEVITTRTDRVKLFRDREDVEVTTTRMWNKTEPKEYRTPPTIADLFPKRRAANTSTQPDGRKKIKEATVTAPGKRAIDL